MKNVYKILISLVIIFVIFIINTKVSFGGKVVDELEKVEITVPEDSTILEILNKVVGIIQVIGGFFAVVVIAYTGFKMVTEQPSEKVKIKEKMLPIIIAILLIFMSATIVKFVIRVFEPNDEDVSYRNGPGLANQDEKVPIKK